MRKHIQLFTVTAAVVLLKACGPSNDDAISPAEETSTTDSQSTVVSNVVDLTIDGMSFVGPHEIKSGWVTVRIHNDSGMTHFGLVYPLPDGVTEHMLSTEVVDRIQESLTATLEGDMEKAQAIYTEIPGWMYDIVFFGGPGATSDETVSEATMYLEPGNYIVECYVKTAGIQHNYNPDPDKPGMVHALTVLDDEGGMPEPDANVTLEIRNSGYTISDGAFVSGHNSVRVKFVEQRKYNNFVGHDAHLFRIDPETDIAAAAQWIDFFPPDGQQTPAPAHYVGGIHDMPQGSVAYFGVDLEPGEYGIVSEIPDTVEKGFMTRFTVSE